MSEESGPCLVQFVGTLEYPRFRLFDPRQGYWTGSTWSQDEDDGLIYADFELACRDLRTIKLAESPDKNKRRYAATVVVDVISDKPVDMAELTTFLSQTAKLTVGEAAPNGSLVFLQIEWATMKRKRGGSP